MGGRGGGGGGGVGGWSLLVTHRATATGNFFWKEKSWQVFSYIIDTHVIVSKRVWQEVSPEYSFKKLY